MSDIDNTELEHGHVNIECAGATSSLGVLPVDSTEEEEEEEKPHGGININNDKEHQLQNIEEESLSRNEQIKVEATSEETEVPDESHQEDEELAMSQPLCPANDDDLDEIVNLAFRIGAAAMKYGSTLDRVERFLTELLKLQGYENVIFRGTQTELCGSVSSNPGRPGRMLMMAFEWGHDLNKLGLLAELAKKIQFQHTDLTIQDAKNLLDEIEQEPDVWGFYWQAIAFNVTGASLAIMFGGTWWDSLLGSIGGGMTFSTIVLLSMLGRRAPQWTDLIASFLCSALASGFKLYRPGVDVALVTLSGCAVLLPGFTITLGTSELVFNNILSGAARLVKGAVTMLWLVVGTWLGITLVRALAPDHLEQGDVVSEPVPPAWQALFVPAVSFSVCIVFQIAVRDIPWALLCMGITYVVSYLAAAQLERTDLGTFLSAVAMTLCANLWAKWADRPSLIVLLPAFIIKVSGTIGFLGLVGLTIEKETKTGLDQLFEMFQVAALLIAGILTGNTLVPSETTL